MDFVKKIESAKIVGENTIEIEILIEGEKKIFEIKLLWEEVLVEKLGKQNYLVFKIKRSSKIFCYIPLRDIHEKLGKNLKNLSIESQKKISLF